MNAAEANGFTVNMANCDWIINQATELKALLSYRSGRMVAINKTRAMSGIDTMADSLNELKCFMNELEG